MQVKMLKNINDQEIIVTSALAKEPCVQILPPTKPLQQNDIFMTLREKREKHKKEKAVGINESECKVNDDTLKEIEINKTGTIEVSKRPATPVCVNPSNSENSLNAVPAVVSQQKSDPSDKQQQEAFSDLLKPQISACDSILNSSNKKMTSSYTPSVTPALFELYVNGEACERLDLTRLLDHASQYIYVFCKISMTILNSRI